MVEATGSTSRKRPPEPPLAHRGKAPTALIRLLRQLVLGIGLLAPASAAGDRIDGGAVRVVGGGEVFPVTGDLFIGERSDGTLDVLGGTVTVDANSTLGRFEEGDGTARLNGAGASWTTGGLRIADAGTAQLTIESGGLLSSTTGSIGHDTGSAGSVTITGAGADWTVQNLLSIGARGSATLRIDSGGRLETSSLAIAAQLPDSSATITVDGAGSTWSSPTVKVGFAGIADLSILSGGTVTDANGYVGELAGADGTVVIDGVDALWESTDTLYAAVAGTADLDLIDGGSISSGWVLAAANLGASSTITIDGAGSSWQVGESFYLGGTGQRAGGTATLSIVNGATLVVGDRLQVWENARLQLEQGTLQIGQIQLRGMLDWTGGVIDHRGRPQGTDFSEGLQVIDGGPKSIAAGSTLGFRGTFAHLGVDPVHLEAGALLQIEDGGTYEFRSNGRLTAAEGAFVDNRGTLIKTGGGGISTVEAPVTNRAVVEARGGTLHFTAGFTQTGGTVQLNGGTIRSTGAFEIEGGALRGTGRFEGDLVNTSGTIRVSQVGEDLNIDGNYTQGAKAVLEVNLRITDTDPDASPLTSTTRVLESDRLRVSGDAHLDGDLRVILQGGMIPLVDERFEFLTFDGSVTGALHPLVAIVPGNPGFEVRFDIDDSVPNRWSLMPVQIVLTAPLRGPEPGAATMWLALVAWTARRRGVR
ncbi:MAG: hypothetical protein CMJ18_06530 [Phycisphaeraceae bacterium]|nr:hypothetical protein [Phycisphaeraceae bacterium]